MLASCLHGLPSTNEPVAQQNKDHGAQQSNFTEGKDKKIPLVTVEASEFCCDSCMEERILWVACKPKTLLSFNSVCFQVRWAWICVRKLQKHKTYLEFCLNRKKKKKGQNISSFAVEKTRVVGKRLVIPFRFSQLQI